MAIELEKFKILTDSATRPDPGRFAMDRPRIEWIDCRERFGGLLNTAVPGFFFSHRHKDPEQVIRFIWRTEEILETEKSIFAKTNRPYASWIDFAPNSIWKESYLKRSLLLILLRSGLNYDPAKNNYEEALYSEKYLNETKPAVMRFLFGFTYCDKTSFDTNGHPNGWFTTFGGMQNGEIKKWLLLPPDKSLKIPILGMSNLWC